MAGGLKDKVTLELTEEQVCLLLGSIEADYNETFNTLSSVFLATALVGHMPSKAFERAESMLEDAENLTKLFLLLMSKLPSWAASEGTLRGIERNTQTLNSWKDIMTTVKVEPKERSCDLN